MVTASPTPWDPHEQHLLVSAAAKATRYNTVPGGTTHDRAQMIPLIHDAHNHWMSPGALRLLHRLVLNQAKRAVLTSAQAWPRHHHLVSLDSASALMREAVIAAWSMHAACGRLL